MFLKGKVDLRNPITLLDQCSGSQAWLQDRACGSSHLYQGPWQSQTFPAPWSCVPTPSVCPSRGEAQRGGQERLVTTGLMPLWGEREPGRFFLLPGCRQKASVSSSVVWIEYRPPPPTHTHHVIFSRNKVASVWSTRHLNPQGRVLRKQSVQLRGFSSFLNLFVIC